MWTLSTLFIVHVHSGHFFRAINILELSFCSLLTLLSDFSRMAELRNVSSETDLLNILTRTILLQ